MQLAECLEVLVLVTAVGCSPLPQAPFQSYMPETTVQPPQVIEYGTEQGVDRYSFNYKLTDGTSRIEGGNLEDGVWIVFWGAEWVDDSNSVVRISSGPTGVSWSINSGPVFPDFPPDSQGALPPTDLPPPFVIGDGGEVIYLKQDKTKPKPLYIKGCGIVYDKQKKSKGLSCLAKASLVGGAAVNYA